MADVLDKETGKPRMLREQCATCVGRPGNLMRLKEGRLKELVRRNSGPHSLGLVCHETIDYEQGEAPDYGGDQAFCRWFYETYGSNFQRVSERLGGFAEVPPPRQGEEAPAR